MSPVIQEVAPPRPLWLSSVEMTMTPGPPLLSSLPAHCQPLSTALRAGVLTMAALPLPQDSPQQGG